MASYEQVELTEEELMEAILLAKQKKLKRLEQEDYQKRVEENRKALVCTQWSYEQTKSYILYRAEQIFAGKSFTLDASNTFIFNLFCHYFSGSDDFVSLSQSIGVKNPSLNKGILLAGNCGVGKTWLVQLFAKNKRQVYFLRNAKMIADAFEQAGEEVMGEYEVPFRNASNDSSVFYQPFSGLCLDDLGTEDLKNHFGNKKNVIGDLLEKRYAKGHVGIMLHATTNLTADQLNAYYGGRVVSRMREIFNFIELRGKDRRK